MTYVITRAHTRAFTCNLHTHFQAHRHGLTHVHTHPYTPPRHTHRHFPTVSDISRSETGNGPGPSSSYGPLPASPTIHGSPVPRLVGSPQVTRGHSGRERRTETAVLVKKAYSLGSLRFHWCAPRHRRPPPQRVGRGHGTRPQYQVLDLAAVGLVFLYHVLREYVPLVVGRGQACPPPPARGRSSFTSVVTSVSTTNYPAVGVLSLTSTDRMNRRPFIFLSPSVGTHSGPQTPVLVCTCVHICVVCACVLCVYMYVRVLLSGYVYMYTHERTCYTCVRVCCMCTLTHECTCVCACTCLPCVKSQIRAVLRHGPSDV